MTPGTKLGPGVPSIGQTTNRFVDLRRATGHEHPVDDRRHDPQPVPVEYRRPAVDNRIMVVRYAIQGDAFVADKPQIWSKRELQVAEVMPTFDVNPVDGRLAVLVRNRPRTRTHGDMSRLC